MLRKTYEQLRVSQIGGLRDFFLYLFYWILWCMCISFHFILLKAYLEALNNTILSAVICMYLYGSVLVSWCAKNRHILTAPEHLLTVPEDL